MVGRQHAYVLVRDWLGEAPPVDRQRALAELARRYLVGHAPGGRRGIWRGGPGCRCATPGRAWPGSRAELAERPTACSSSRRRDAIRRRPRRQAARAHSSPCCSVGRSREFIAGDRAGRVVVGVACSGRSRSSAGAWPPCGGWPATRWRSSPCRRLRGRAPRRSRRTDGGRGLPRADPGRPAPARSRTGPGGSARPPRCARTRVRGTPR